MSRCEEIFRQICWLEERFWPDVDGMGEDNENARLDSPAFNAQGLGNGAEGGSFAGSGMGVAMSGNGINAQSINGQTMNRRMSSNGMNGQRSGPMNTSMTGPRSLPQINTNLNNGAAPGSDTRNAFGNEIEGGIESVTIGS
jgi:hypothetical protein